MSRNHYESSFQKECAKTINFPKTLVVVQQSSHTSQRVYQRWPPYSFAIVRHIICPHRHLRARAKYLIWTKKRAAVKNLADRLELIFSDEIKAFGSNLSDKKRVSCSCAAGRPAREIYSYLVRANWCTESG